MSNLRKRLIRVASELPRGPERKKLLALLDKTALTVKVIERESSEDAMARVLAEILDKMGLEVDSVVNPLVLEDGTQVSLMPAMKLGVTVLQPTMDEGMETLVDLADRDFSWSVPMSTIARWVVAVVRAA